MNLSHPFVFFMHKDSSSPLFSLCFAVLLTAVLQFNISNVVLCKTLCIILVGMLCSGQYKIRNITTQITFSSTKYFCNIYSQVYFVELLKTKIAWAPRELEINFLPNIVMHPGHQKSYWRYDISQSI